MNNYSQKSIFVSKTNSIFAKSQFLVNTKHLLLVLFVFLSTLFFSSPLVLAQPVSPTTPDFGLPTADSSSSVTSLSGLVQSQFSVSSAANSITDPSTSYTIDSGSRSSNQISSSQISQRIIPTAVSSTPKMEDILPETTVRSGASSWIISGIFLLVLALILWYSQKYLQQKTSLKSASNYTAKNLKPKISKFTKELGAKNNKKEERK